MLKSETALFFFEMKTCTKCNQTKPSEAFHRGGTRTADGRQSQCKECRCQHMRRRWPSFRNNRLQNRYGICNGAFEEMHQEQAGRCAICGEHPANKEMSVDHDHATGIVRGLLCNKCNMVLGLMKDSPKLLRNAADYLEQATFGFAPAEKDL